jgi:hypothetical protein
MQSNSNDALELFRGKPVSDVALYDLYVEQLDIFHGWHPDDTNISAKQKQAALVEMSEIRREAIRRSLITGETFGTDPRVSLVTQSLEELRNEAQKPTMQPGGAFDMRPDAKPNMGTKSNGTRGTIRGASNRKAQSPGQLGLFG